MLQSTGRFLLCAFLATIISPIVADYVIDVKLIKFENYNRLLANGRTCSIFGNQQCQTTLEVCARPGDSSTLCSYGNTKTGVIGDNFIDLNKTLIGFTRNPITYLVTQPFQKFVVSFTAKSSNELIAEYVYQSGSRLPQRSVEEARYELITTRGSQNPSSQLTYQIRSYCSQGYYGPNCATRCDIPISEQTRFTCGPNGEKVCKPGFTGPFCTPDSDPCRSAPCKNSGTCVQTGSTYKCICKPLYTGPTCLRGIDDCIQAPCLHGGTCVDEIDGHYCRCAYGYTGPRCEIALSACLSKPCMNGGTCLDQGTSFVCQCLPNFYGNRCQLEDKCRSVTCLNGGTCYPNGVQFTCQCPVGFTGQRCEQPFCSPNICQNGGRCQLVNNQITCICLNGFQGDRCQVAIQCYPKCQNGGICNGNTRICDCPHGFGGRDCSTRDLCASKPCHNNGQCFVQNTFDYVCVCPQGWTGKNCDSIITSCSNNPCFNGGQCQPVGNSFVCNCVNGWSGKTCTERTPIFYCPSRPCLNGGTCIKNANELRCQCLPGFKGIYCEVPDHQGHFKCPQSAGLFPDPQSCRHFYQCDWDIAYRKDCPGNLHFNKFKKVCDWQYRANCNIGK